MMQSKLLDFIVKKATELAVEDGVSVITNNYFVLSVLEFIRDNAVSPFGDEAEL